MFSVWATLRPSPEFSPVPKLKSPSRRHPFISALPCAAPPFIHRGRRWCRRVDILKQRNSSADRRPHLGTVARRFGSVVVDVEEEETPAPRRATSREAPVRAPTRQRRPRRRRRVHHRRPRRQAQAALGGLRRPRRAVHGVPEHHWAPAVALEHRVLCAMLQTSAVVIAVIACGASEHAELVAASVFEQMPTVHVQEPPAVCPVTSGRGTRPCLPPMLRRVCPSSGGASP